MVGSIDNTESEEKVYESRQKKKKVTEKNAGRVFCFYFFILFFAVYVCNCYMHRKKRQYEHTVETYGGTLF